MRYDSRMTYVLAAALAMHAGAVLAAGADKSNKSDTSAVNSSATGSSAANANDSNTSAARSGSGDTAANELPKSGQVSREGTVERVVDNDSFIFRDKLTNKTVDVHTSSAAAVKAGDRVQVSGKAQSEVMGIGHEIVDAQVKLSGMGGPLNPPMDEEAVSTMDRAMDNRDSSSSDAPASKPSDTTSGSSTRTGTSSTSGSSGSNY